MADQIDSGAKSLADRANKGSYFDHASLKGYKHPDVKHIVFMKELEEHLAAKGLKLVAKRGSSVVHSPRGGAKYGKATGYTIHEIDNSQHQEQDAGQFSEKLPEFVRYDHHDINHLQPDSYGLNKARKDGRLVGAHWQHKDGGQGITGYAPPDVVKKGVTSQGHKVLAHQTKGEDHISQAEFNKRYASQHSETRDAGRTSSQFSESRVGLSAPSLSAPLQFREEPAEQFAEKEYKVLNHGGAGYIVKHKSGLMLSAFPGRGEKFGWTSHDDNAAVHDSREQAHERAKAAIKHSPPDPDQYN